MLLGREREMQVLEQALATARSGRSAVLALVGEPGIGKTSLLDHAVAQAKSMRLLRARGVESESNVPFAALFSVLRPVLGLTSRLPEPQARALEAALALRPGDAGERFAVGAATLGLLAAAAEESPTLVVVDDAHLLDGSSAEALVFALRRLLAEPLAVLLAVRTDEPSLLDGADLPVLTVAGLDLEASSILLGPVGTDVASRLHGATAGNPLALLELSADAPKLGAAGVDEPIPVPARISQAFARRADVLDALTRRVLVVAAADNTGDLVTLQRAASELELRLDGLGAAEACGLIRVRDARVEFTHPLALAAIYDAASPEERRAAHRAIARVLPDRDVDRRAWHLAAAAVGGDDATASALEQAGVRARQRSAYAVAASAFARASKLSMRDEDRSRLLVAAADAAWLGGQAERAVDLLDQARRCAPDDERLLQIERLRGHIAVRRGPVMDGHAVLVAAAAAAGAANAEIAIGMLAEAVDAAFYAGNPHEMATTAERIAGLMTPDASPRARFLAATTHGMAKVFTGDEDRGIASFRAAIRIAEQHAELHGDADLHYWHALAALWVRDAHTGRGLIDEAIAAARTDAALARLPRLLTLIARDHSAGDDWASAALEWDEGLRFARETGQRSDLTALLAGFAWLEARQGRAQECRAHAEEARELSRQMGMGVLGVWAIRALGDLELGLGNADAAAGFFEDADRTLAELGVQDVDLSAAPELVEASLRIGRVAEARAAAEAFEARATRKGQPWSLARAARVRGLLASDDAIDQPFADALALHARTVDAFELACTHLAYGARLRRSRRRIDARHQLRIALAIFERLGADPWSEATRTELLSSGETARKREYSMINALTRQEFHIARVMAEGRTTREVAAALFLSPKTIEYHLRSVYRKLGVNNRADLASALAAPADDTAAAVRD